MNCPPRLLSPCRVRQVARPGFTLVEVLVTVAIAAALVGAGAPAMGRLLANHAVVDQASVMVEAMRRARSEAMKRSGPVVLCKTDPLAPLACSRDPRIGWQTWMVFADLDRSGAYEAGEPVILAQARPPDRVAVSAATSLGRVRFEPSGIALADDGGSVAIFLLTPQGMQASPGSTSQRRICLDSRGRLVVLDGTGVCA